MLKRGMYLALFLLLVSLVSAVRFIEDSSYLGGGYGYFFDFGGYGSISDFDIVQFYQDYGSIIDGALFLLVFIGIGMTALRERFGSGARNLYIGMGIIFTIALMLWEKKNNFYLLNEFGPIAFIVFIALVIVVVFNFFRGMGATGLYAVAIAYIIFFFAFIYYVDHPDYSSVRDFLDKLPWINMLKVLMLILLGIAVLILLIGMFTLFRRGGR